MASVFEDDTLPSRPGLSLPWLHLTLFKLQITDTLMSRAVGVGPHEHIFPWESDLLYPFLTFSLCCNSSALTLAQGLTKW